MIVVEYRDGHNPPQLQTYSSLLELVAVIRRKDHQSPSLIQRLLEEDKEYWAEGSQDVWDIITPDGLRSREDYLREMQALMKKAKDEIVGMRHLFDGALCGGDGKPDLRFPCLMRHYNGTRAQKPENKEK